MNLTEEEKELDIKDLKKTIKLQNKQLQILDKGMFDLTNAFNQYMQYTNKSIKLHEAALGVLSTKYKQMTEGR